MGRAADGRKHVMPAWLAFASKRIDLRAEDLAQLGLPEKAGHAPQVAADEDSNGGWGNVVRAVEEDR